MSRISRRELTELEELAELRRRVERLEGTALSKIHRIGQNWQNYTPVLTASTTNPTLGTGGVAQGRYVAIGGTVIYRFFFQFGTSGVNGGDGEYRVSAPVSISPNTPAGAYVAFGNVVLFDWSVAGHKELGVVSRVTSTRFNMQVDNATVFHNNPFTWAADDRFGGTVVYEKS